MMKPAYRVEDVTTAFRCDPEQEEIISALAERDYRIFEVEQPSGALVPYHAHEEEESIIVLRGTMQFNVEEEIVPVEQGKVITIRARAVHAAAPVGEAPAKLLIAFAGEAGPAEETPEDGWEGGEVDEGFGFA